MKMHNLLVAIFLVNFSLNAAETEKEKAAKEKYEDCLQKCDSFSLPNFKYSLTHNAWYELSKFQVCINKCLMLYKRDLKNLDKAKINFIYFF